MMPIARIAIAGSPVDDTSTGRPEFISTDSVSDVKAMPSDRARRARP